MLARHAARRWLLRWLFIPDLPQSGQGSRGAVTDVAALEIKAVVDPVTWDAEASCSTTDLLSFYVTLGIAR